MEQMGICQVCNCPVHALWSSFLHLGNFPHHSLQRLRRPQHSRFPTCPAAGTQPCCKWRPSARFLLRRARRGRGCRQHASFGAGGRRGSSFRERGWRKCLNPGSAREGELGSLCERLRSGRASCGSLGALAVQPSPCLSQRLFE